MTRTQHQLHPTKSFPVYCLDWTDDTTLLLGGGGGATKSGIGNKLKLVDVSRDGRRVKDVYELGLSSEEDAPMTLALDRATSQLVTGINASQATIEGGKNEQCRVFSYADNKLAFVRSQNTINAQWSDDYPYQKLTALSIPPTEGASASFVATGTTDNQVTVLAFPSLEVVVPPFNVEGGDLVDLDWGGPLGAWLAITTTSQLAVYAFAYGKLTLIQTIAAPKGEDAPLLFRAARFAPDSPEHPAILAALNSPLPPRRDTRRKARKAFIAKFEPSVAEIAEKDEKQEVLDEKVDGKSEEPSLTWKFANKREVAGKPITVFDVSPNGRLVSFGCSDLSVGMLDAHTLSPLLKILHAHSFPPTALKFNPSATMLVSASADNTIRTFVVPSSFGASVPSTLVMLILALLVFVLAVLLRK
jgi:prolactin regulatory element-binding protein